MKKMYFIPYAIALVLSILVAYGLYLLALPAFNIHSSGMWWYMLSVTALSAGIFFIATAIANAYDEMDLENRYTPTIVIAIISAIILVVFTCISLFGVKLFNAKKYQKILTVEEGKFEEDIPNLSEIKDTVIVDVDNAERVGDPTITNVKNSSWYEVDDEYNLIMLNNEPYRISSLNYGGLFKFNKAKSSGIPGFVLVNAKTQEAKFVETSEPMKYSPSAYFSYDLKRHLRFQYPKDIFGKSFFEVDDNLVPYWITSVKETKIALTSGEYTEFAILTNAITGESQKYAINDLPKWVDHVTSLDSLMDLLYYNYSYKNGFWNLSKTDSYSTSYSYRSSKSKDNDKEKESKTDFAGYNSVVDKNGEIWFYTGITPSNKAESNIGFVLISPRTCKAKFYNVNGAEESNAQKAVQGLVQNLGYTASFPTVVNVDGVETYYMLLKDSAGLIQRYALTNIKNYNQSVQAETLSEAIKLYKDKIGITKEQPKEEVKNINLEAKVTLLNEAEIDGCTFYYFNLEESDLIFISTIKNSNEQPLKLQKGQTVSIEYHVSDGTGIVTNILFK